MKGHLQLACLILIALAGILGSILGARALNEAATRSQNLYRVDTAGSQVESDLEFETQESRRAFLYALPVTDPNQQLPYIDAAREASQRVREGVRRLRLFDEPEIARCVQDFEQRWNEYDRARDEIMAQILEGHANAALRIERGRGQAAFAAALRALHALKSTLEGHARANSALVNSTLRRSMAGLAAFVLCTCLIVGLLARANRGRLRALESLRSTNAVLAAAREAEKQRASILEMVSTHTELQRTLTRIAEAVSAGCHQRAGTVIWVVADAELRFQVSANLPPALVEGLEMDPVLSATSLPGAEDFLSASAVRARQFGFTAYEPKVLRDGSGHSVGALQMFSPQHCELQCDSLLEQMGQLASVAIENRLLYERLTFQAQHDTLTGLPNRLLFQDRVQQATRLAARRGNGVAVIWIDLDKYKQVNDSLGHRLGDEVLCGVARRLESCLRKSDTVARLGGDEFTVLLHDLTGPGDAETICAKILNTVARPMKLSGHDVTVTASAGISVFPEHGEEPGALLRNADLAMYMAKRAGGNSSSLFRSALGDSLERRVLLEQELKTALERGEFFIEYQPLVSRNGSLDGVEALLRWLNPSIGKVSPAEFIPIAEQTGLIGAIGAWVTRSACRDGARWLKAGYQIPRIAVNVSALQFINQGFADLVDQVLREYQFPPEKLEFEITETALMDNLDQAIEQIEPLRRLGVRFAIDDFGTGYSSLSQLRTLPVDSVKIDRSFVKDLERGGNGCTTLVRGIIALAHNLQLKVVAEGVETEEQLALLNGMGCDISQGFFLHRPMPAPDLEKLLRKPRPLLDSPPAAKDGFLAPAPSPVGV
jgi:diguanylate cyclase (GGDEF)-like protein